MKKIQIFEPAICCPTGLCGVGVARELPGHEIPWINRVDAHTKGRFAVIAWSATLKMKSC